MAANSERILISNSVKKYSIESFIDHFQQIVKNVNTNKIKP